MADALHIAASPTRHDPISFPEIAARPRVQLGGVLLDQVDLAAASDRIRGFLKSSSSHQIMTVNLDFVSIARRDPVFRGTLNRSDLAVADGMPLVWLSRLKARPLPERVTGVELVDRTCAIAAETGQSVFLLGAHDSVAETAGRRLVEQHPGLRVAGAYSPPFGGLSADEDRRIVDAIKESEASILFVAFGAPRQDLWIAEQLDDLGVRVAMGVGCVFDLLAGVVKRAPGWAQQAGLEWTYRLVHEPRRLWRRYFLQDLPMLAQLMLPGVDFGLADGPSVTSLPRNVPA